MGNQPDNSSGQDDAVLAVRSRAAKNFFSKLNATIRPPPKLSEIMEQPVCAFCGGQFPAGQDLKFVANENGQDLAACDKCASKSNETKSIPDGTTIPEH